ncbi:hypothetical protein F8S12_07335 [Nostoc sp. WHI]|nr:hypothetical protein [Nostoc sp. WHI]
MGSAKTISPKNSFKVSRKLFLRITFTGIGFEPGDCIAFDNKQPHGIKRVLSERWCICFFRLKPEYLVGEKVQQLT